MADTIKYSKQEFPGNGSTVQWNFNFAGGYLSRDHVRAFVTAADGTRSTPAFTFNGPNTLVVSPAVPAGSKLTIYRDTPKDAPLANFTDGAVLTEANLDKNAQQAVFIAAEAADSYSDLPTDEKMSAAIAAANEVAAGLGALDGKVDRTPTFARSMLRIGYAKALDDTFANWISGGIIKRTSGGGGDNGRPIKSGQPSMWQRATMHTALFSCWRTAVTDGDTANAARLAAAIEGTWADTKSAFTVEAMQRGNGGVVYTMDDFVLYALYLREVASYYGPTTTEGARALSYLVEIIPACTEKFRDPYQTGNDLIDYGVSTPTLGIPFKSNAWGILYGLGNGPQYGHMSNSIETGLAFCALYLVNQPSVPSALRSAFRQYAENVWDWAFNHMRTGVPDPADPGRPVEGIYFADFNLDPNVDAAHDLSFNGGNPVRGEYDTHMTFRRPYAEYFGRPVRELCAHYGGGTVFMGLLSARLWQVTGLPRYAAEAVSVGRAMISTNGFGRMVDGMLHLATLRDPHSDGDPWPSFMRIALTIPGFDADFALRGALIRTARKLMHGSVRGYLGPDWAGQEINPANGTSTWGETSLNQLGAGGGQACGDQIMVHGGSLCIVATAMQFADLEKQIDASGNVQTMLEQASHLLVAARSVQETAPHGLRGAFNVPVYVKDKLHKLDIDENGNPRWQWGDDSFISGNRTNGDLIFLEAGQQQAKIASGGNGITSNGLFRPNNSANVVFKAAGGINPQIIGDASGSCYQYDSVNGWHQFWKGSNELFRVNPTGAASMGALSAAGVIIHSADNAWSFGTASARATQVYAVNSTINTSDQTEKAWRGGLTPTELEAARRIAAEIGAFRWLDAIAEKGDDARIHIGVRAQAVWDIMAELGLVDPREPNTASSRYSFLCYDCWSATAARPSVVYRDEAGNITGSVPAVPASPAGERYGIRSSELQYFIAAGQEQRILALEAAINK